VEVDEACERRGCVGEYTAVTARGGQHSTRRRWVLQRRAASVAGREEEDPTQGFEIRLRKISDMAEISEFREISAEIHF